MSSNIEKLNKLSFGNKSDWYKEAMYRRENIAWLSISASLSINIITEMEKQNLSAKYVADKMNISIYTLRKMLSGNYNLSLKIISEFESILNVKLININPIN